MWTMGAMTEIVKWRQNEGQLQSESDRLPDLNQHEYLWKSTGSF